MATYQIFVAPIGNNLANWQAYVQFFGAGFTTAGWVAQTGHGEVTASGTGASYAFTSPILPPATAVNPSSGYTFRGAFSNSTAYTGTAAANNPNDLVTSGGVTYVCLANNSLVLTQAAISGTTVTYTGTITGGGVNLFAGMSFTIAGFVNAGNNGTFVITSNTTTTLVCTNAAGVNETHAGTANGNPSSTVANTQWAPYQYEIWKSNGAASSTFPLYVRLAYVGQGGAQAIRVLISIGTGIDVNGNVTNPITIAASAPVGLLNWDNNTATSSSPFEMDFSGDSDNFRLITQRGNTVSTTYTGLLVCDRSRNASGVATDAFAYIGFLRATAGNSGSFSGILCNSSVSPTPIMSSSLAWPGTMCSGGITTTTVLNGGVPPFFVYPLVGYQAPPLMGCVGFHNKDVTDGTLTYVWNYGAMHAYIACTFNAANSASTSIDNSTNGIVAAILWE